MTDEGTELIHRRFKTTACIIRATSDQCFSYVRALLVQFE